MISSGAPAGQGELDWSGPWACFRLFALDVWHANGNGRKAGHFNINIAAKLSRAQPFLAMRQSSR
jgi:hypothetical protein